ncbi:zeaxanthin epoxidase [Pyrus ussuriensis x Pyrus communis]|uniref:Zeaxanthin epoxidase n=1 Tax=Pyrus ussuriensis x Pyrus communis TaxID=2448454 RepID=A0A5N5H289_9ROSA|nr:zeaxanthin epoxidase [Pyrus ussuriensis x Pyrus communis]
MEIVEDVVIVGAGISGLATSLGLHRLGIRSLVLESSDSLRTTGFALTTWTNAWKALDALGIGDSLRQQHVTLDGNVTSSRITGLQTSQMSFDAKGKHGDHEVRCVKRNLLLEALANDLPNGTIRFLSKVVSIDESGLFKLVHLADGTVLKAKVLVGCDGVNSVVAKWLGFKQPAFTGRSAIRGCANFKGSHGFDPLFMQYFGNGIRSGSIPCDDKTVYWFITWSPSSQEKELEENPGQLKQYMLSKLGKIPDKVKAVVENTELDAFVSSPLRYRHPWEILWGNISKGNVCVAGDALHPMTPDIGQGGCAALEDSVVLARCLGEALLKSSRHETKDKAGEEGKEEHERIETGLKKYATERRWRSFDLISTALVVGFFQEGNGKIMNFLRDKCLAPILAGLLLKKSDFDCGKLSIS